MLCYCQQSTPLHNNKLRETRFDGLGWRYMEFSDNDALWIDGDTAYMDINKHMHRKTIGSTSTHTHTASACICMECVLTYIYVWMYVYVFIDLVKLSKSSCTRSCN